MLMHDVHVIVRWLRRYKVQKLLKYIYIYSCFEKGCRKKSTKGHATRPKGGLGIHYNFAYWPRGNVQVCIFEREEFVFPLRRLFSVALLLLSHVFEF